MKDFDQHPSDHVNSGIQRRDALRKMGLIVGVGTAAVTGSAIVNAQNAAPQAAAPIPAVGGAELGGLAVLAAAVAAYQLRKKDKQKDQDDQSE